MYFAHVKSEHYPLSDRKLLPEYQKYNNYGRHCTKARKRVAVTFKKSHKVKHMKYSHLKNKYVYTPCDECQKDFDTYKWVEPKKDEEPFFTQSSKNKMLFTEKSVPVPAKPSGQQEDVTESQEPSQEPKETKKENAAACNCGKTNKTEELKTEKEEGPVEESNEESDEESEEQRDSDDNDEFEKVSPSVESRLQDLELGDEDFESEFEMLIS